MMENFAPYYSLVLKCGNRKSINDRKQLIENIQQARTRIFTLIPSQSDTSLV